MQCWKETALELLGTQGISLKVNLTQKNDTIRHISYVVTPPIVLKISTPSKLAPLYIVISFSDFTKKKKRTLINVQFLSKVKINSVFYAHLHYPFSWLLC